MPMLFSRYPRAYDRRDHAIHMILVAQQTVLTRYTACVTGLAKILLHRTEIGHESLRIALLVALQVGAGFFKLMAGQTTAVLQDAEMWLMDEVREASLFARDRNRGEINDPPFALNIIDAVAFRARPLSILARGESKTAAAGLLSPFGAWGPVRKSQE